MSSPFHFNQTCKLLYSIHVGDYGLQYLVTCITRISDEIYEAYQGETVLSTVPTSVYFVQDYPGSLIRVNNVPSHKIEALCMHSAKGIDLDQIAWGNLGGQR